MSVDPILEKNLNIKVNNSMKANHKSKKEASIPALINVNLGLRRTLTIERFTCNVKSAITQSARTC